MKNLRSKLFIIMLLICLLPMLTATLYSYQIARRSLDEKINTVSTSALQVIAKGIDSELQKLLTMMEVVTSSKEFQAIVHRFNTAATYGDEWLAQRDLDLLMLGTFGSSDLVDGIYFTSLTGKSYAVKDTYSFDLSSFSKNPWFQNEENNTGILTNCGLISLKDQKSALVFGRVLRDTAYWGNLSVIGSIHFAINPQFLQDISTDNDLYEISSLLIYDNSDRLLSRSAAAGTEDMALYTKYAPRIAESESGSIADMPTGKTILYYISDIYRYRILQCIPSSAYTSELSRITDMTLLFSLSCLILIIFISYYVSRSISHPIQILNGAMERAESGNFDIEVKTTRKDEIGQITRRFNLMLSRLKKVFNQSIEDEKLKKKLEISALQYQINPHFLYNTLASVRSLTLMEGAEQSSAMLDALSRLLKNTIGNAGMLIPLELEIENLRRLLFIQNTCHADTIDSDIRIDEACFRCLVPNLLLQPIVENAIFYGINPDSGRVSITIRAGLDDGLWISVSDTGPGIPDSLQMQIFEDPDSQRRGDSLNHIGLRNIDQRIRLNFGDSYGLRLHSGSFGTEIQILLPVLYERGETTL